MVNAVALSRLFDGITQMVDGCSVLTVSKILESAVELIVEYPLGSLVSLVTSPSGYERSESWGRLSKLFVPATISPLPSASQDIFLILYHPCLLTRLREPSLTLTA